MHTKNNFDFLRFIAAAAVIVGHSYPLSGREYASGIIFLGAGVHTWGVMVFFVISGYLITASWTSGRDLPTFFLKRALRIFPALSVVVLISVFIVGPAISQLPLAQYFSAPFAWLYLANIVLYPVYSLPGVLANNPYPHAVNGSLWTLPVEFFMYVLTPVLAALGRRRGHVFVLGTVTCAMYAVGWWLWQPGAPRLVVYGTDVRSALAVAGYFTAGAMARLLAKRVRFHLGYAAVLMAVLVLVWQFLPAYRPIWGLLQIFAVAYFVLSCAFSTVVPLSRFGAYGDFSYGLYLYAFPIQQLIIRSFPALSPVTFAVASLACTLPCAVASWHLIEKRMLRLKGRIAANQTSFPGRAAST